MPLRTETLNFDEEEQRLSEKIDEIDDVLEDIDDSDIEERFRNERGELETRLEGVRWARDEAFEADYAPMWDQDVDAVELGGLTGGEFGRLEDDALESGGGQGAIRVYQVEMGTVDAPYLDDGMDKDQRIATISQLPISYLKWAQFHIDRLTGVGGNGETNYAELYAEMRRAQSDQA